MSQIFRREPCFFINPHPEYNRSDRESYVVRDGKRLRVKRPQAPHQGDYEQPVRLRGEGSRYFTVVKTNGNAVFYTITSGAGDADTDSEYARERKQKLRACGWYRLGSCPVALLKNAELQPGHFFDQSLLTEMPCNQGTHSLANPCPHALAEQRARIAANNAIGAAQEEAGKNKLLEAQKAQTAAIVEAQKAQTDALVSAILAKTDKASKAGKSE